ncbi:MAG: tyrosine-type recombinase/integrase [Solirubrobacteraceae bacterium]
MASENAPQRGSQQPETRFREHEHRSTRAARRAPAQLPESVADVLDSYVSALAAGPLAEQTRRTYASKVRQYLAWLAGAELDGDLFDSADGRDWAVRDYRAHLQAVLKRKPATVNGALAAVDDFYIRRGLAAASAKRAEIPDAAPRALDHKAQIRYLRAVQGCRSPRDKALALVPFYAGARLAETVALDLDDVRLSARKGILRIYGKGERVREVPIHPELRKALPAGARSAATGRERKTAPRCFSTSAATG